MMYCSYHAADPRKNSRCVESVYEGTNKDRGAPYPYSKTAAGSTLVLGGDGVQSTMANDDTFV